MKTNQLLSKAVRLLFGVFFAFVFGLLSGDVYSKSKDDVLIKVDKTMVSNDIEVGDYAAVIEFTENNDCYLIGDNTPYTMIAAKKSWMNMDIVSSNNSIIFESKLRAQQTVKKPNLPPPRRCLARSDLIDTS